MSVVYKKYKQATEKATKEMEKLTGEMDKLYKEYKSKLGQLPKVPPSEREDFNVCSPKYVTKALKYIPPSKEAREKYIADMLNACTSCAVSQRELPKPKRPMTGWVCYLKTCAKITDQNYTECMVDKNRKATEYEPKKQFWSDEALEGCPSGV